MNVAIFSTLPAEFWVVDKKMRFDVAPFPVTPHLIGTTSEYLAQTNFRHILQKIVCIISSWLVWCGCIAKGKVSPVSLLNQFVTLENYLYAHSLLCGITLQLGSSKLHFSFQAPLIWSKSPLANIDFTTVTGGGWGPRRYPWEEGEGGGQDRLGYGVWETNTMTLILVTLESDNHPDW